MMDKDQKKFLLSEIPSRYMHTPEPIAPKEVVRARRIVAAWNKAVTKQAERRRKHRDKQIAAIKRVIYIEGNEKKALNMIQAMERER